MLRPLAHLIPAVLLPLLVVADKAQGQPLTPWGSAFTPQAVTLIYDPADGNLTVNAGGEKFTTIELISARERFVPDPECVDGPFVPPGHRCFNAGFPSKVFELFVEGADSYDFGQRLPAGLRSQDIIADVSVNGSMLGGGGLNKYVESSPHLYVVPEPSGFILLGVGVICFVHIVCRQIPYHCRRVITCRYRNGSLTLLIVFSLTAASQAQLVQGTSANNADATTLVYVPANGELWVNGGGTPLTTIQIISAGSLFRPDGAMPVLLRPPHPGISEAKLFLLGTDGFAPGPHPDEALNFGTILAPGLTAETLVADFLVVGSYLGGGNLTAKGGGGPFLHVVPEPSSATLVGIGSVLLLASRRRLAGSRWRKPWEC